jgi:hypothetical protein
VPPLVGDLIVAVGAAAVDWKKNAMVVSDVIERFDRTARPKFVLVGGYAMKVRLLLLVGRTSKLALPLLSVVASKPVTSPLAMLVGPPGHKEKLSERSVEPPEIVESGTGLFDGSLT